MSIRPMKGVAIGFQFHKGSIRTAITILLNRKNRCFNSIKVQLEPAKMNWFTFDIACFNSIKVQLELPSDKILEGVFLFQFHKGAIRTSSTVLSFWGLLASFNSIKVQLELYRDIDDHSGLAFQFHKGSIRTKDTYLRNKQGTNVSIP